MKNKTTSLALGAMITTHPIVETMAVTDITDVSGTVTLTSHLKHASTKRGQDNNKTW